MHFKFTGQRLDGTGLYYYGARYYDAEIGRFISPDSIVQNYANPQSLNRYSYVFNNPLKYVDSSGMIVEFENEDLILGIFDDLLEYGMGYEAGSAMDRMIQDWVGSGVESGLWSPSARMAAIMRASSLSVLAFLPCALRNWPALNGFTSTRLNPIAIRK